MELSAIRVHRTGGPEVMIWEKVHVPSPGPGEVRVRHTAVGLNFLDTYFRSGLYPTPLPFVPGAEAAGVVDELGEGVTTFRKGERVVYAGSTGSYAQARVIAAENLVRMPDDVDDRTAAAVLLQGLTARFLIKDVYPVKSGEFILVHAAAGGVGTLLCQWASALGAQVIGTVSSDEKAKIAASNGCLYPIVHGREDFVARVAEITGGKKLKVVYDSTGRDTFSRSLDCLMPMGLMVVFGQSSGPIDPLEINLLGRKGSLVLTRPMLPDFMRGAGRLQQTADELFEALRRGILRVVVNKTYDLREAATAHRDLEERRTTGSIVFDVPATDV